MKRFKINKKFKIIFSALVIGIILPIFIVCAFYRPTTLNKFINNAFYNEALIEVALTSDDYIIDEDNDVIYYNNTFNKDNINISFDNEEIDEELLTIEYIGQDNLTNEDLEKYDLNNDKKINNDDLTVLSQCLANDEDTDCSKADINEDGEIDSKDSDSLKDYIIYFNNLTIWYNKDMIENYEVKPIKITSNMHAVTDDSVVAVKGEFDFTSLKTNIGTLNENKDTGKIEVVYNGKVYKTLSIIELDVSIVSDDYIITNNKIYYPSKFNEDNVKLMLDDKENTNEKITFQVNGMLTDEQLANSDINSDGMIDINDVTLLNNCVAKVTDVCSNTPGLGDVNLDGEVEFMDTLALLKYVAEINSFKIMYDNSPIKSYSINLIKLTSDVYTIKTDSFAVAKGSLDLDLLETNIGTLNENKLTKNLEIIYNDKVYKTYEIHEIDMSVTSDKYTIDETNNSIYCLELFDEENMKLVLNNQEYDSSLLSMSYTNNKLLIQYNGDTIKKYNVVTFSAESDDYIVDEANKTIYYGDVKFDKNNFSYTFGDKVYDSELMIIEYADNVLTIKYNEKIAKTYTVKPINITSGLYTITDNYLYLGTSALDLTKLETNVGTLKESDNNLEVVYNDNVYKTIPIIKLETDYIVSGDNIYTIIDEFSIGKVNVINGTKSIDSGYLVIKHNGSSIKSYSIKTINLTSDKYTIGGNNITTNDLDFDTNNIKFTLDNKEYTNENLSLEYINNKLVVKYYDKEIKSFSVDASSTNSNFKDDNFYSCVIDAYNKENSTSHDYSYNLSDEELATIKELECDGMKKEDDSAKVSDTTGLEKLTGLTYLSLVGNNITSIDVSNNTLLTYLELTINKLTTIDVTKNTSLKTLIVNSNQLNEIDVTQNTLLTKLELVENSLTTIDLTKNKDLTNLKLNDNNLTNLDLSKNTKLESLDVTSNNISELSVNHLTLLTYLNLKDNKLTNLDVTKLTKLNYLYVDHNELTSIDLTNNKELTRLELWENKLESIDLSQNTKLTFLIISNNSLKELDLSSNTLLEEFVINDNPFEIEQKAYINILTAVKNPVKLPSENSITYKSVTPTSDNYTIDTKGNITFNKTGTYELTFTYSINSDEEDTFDVKTKFNINSFITAQSDDYIIDNSNNIIYYSEVFDKENISFVGENLQFNTSQITTEYTNDTLIVKYDGVEFTTYTVKPINITSGLYSVTDNYLYLGTSALDLTKLETNIGTLKESDNNLEVVYDDKTYKTIPLIKLDTDYIVSGDNIYTIIDEFSVGNIKVINGKRTIDSGDLVIKTNNGSIIKSYSIKTINITSDKYTINEDSIIASDFEFDKSNIKFTLDNKEFNDDNLSLEYKNNKLIIKYYDKEIKTFNVDKLSIVSDDYIIDEENKIIYYGTTFNKDKITFAFGSEEYTGESLTTEYSNNKLIIKNNGNEIDSYETKEIKLSSDIYTTASKNYIFTEEETLDITSISSNIGTLKENEESNVIEVIYNDKVYKTVPIIKIDTSYMIKNDTVYLIDEEISLSKFKVSNATVSIESDNLLIKYNGSIIKSYEIKTINVTSNEYLIKDDNITIYNFNFDVEKIKLVIDGKEYTDDDIEIFDTGYEIFVYYGEKELKVYNINKINIVSGEYIIDNDEEIIYYGGTSFNKDNILFELNDEKYTSDKLTLEYTNESTLTKEELENADLNSDGSVNSDDIKALREYLANYDYENPPEYTTKGDVNSDGIIDAKDLTLLRRYVEKLYTLNIKYDGSIVKSYAVMPIVITSALYDIKDDYIFIGATDLDFSKIETNAGFIDYNFEENLLEVKDYSQDKVYKSYKLIIVSFGGYIVKGDTVYTMMGDIATDFIGVTNADFDLKDDKLNIKYNNNIIKTYNIKNISISSTDYVIEYDNIYVSGNLSLDKINVTNATLKLEDDKLKVLIDEEEVKEYNIVKVSVTSDVVEIKDNYIITYNKEVVESYINTNIGYVIIDNNTVKIEYNGNVIVSYKIIYLNSSDYIIGKDYIYTGTSTFNSSKITSNGSVKLNNGKLELRDDSTLLKTFDIVNINFGSLNVSNKIITINNDMSYSDFVKEISPNGVTYKIVKDVTTSTEENKYEEITSGNITGGLLFRIYKNDEFITAYSINQGYYKIVDSTVKVDEAKDYISNIKDGKTAQEIKTIVETSGVITVLDKDNQTKNNTDLVATGDKIKIDLGGTRTFTYTLIVNGDVNGDGEVNAADAFKIIRHSLGKETLGNEYFLAGDIDSSDELNAADAFKIVRYSLGKDTNL